MAQELCDRGLEAAEVVGAHAPARANRLHEHCRRDGRDEGAGEEVRRVLRLVRAAPERSEQRQQAPDEEYAGEVVGVRVLDAGNGHVCREGYESDEPGAHAGEPARAARARGEKRHGDAEGEEEDLGVVVAGPPLADDGSRGHFRSYEKAARREQDRSERSRRARASRENLEERAERGEGGR